MHCGASIGICQGGGAGKYLAQWMVHGQAEINMREFDPRRFGDWATQGLHRARSRVADYQHMYYCYKPAEQHEVGRGLRKSSLHDTLKARGAQFSQVFGWERARWYDPSGEGERFSFKRSNWWEPVREECLAVRERVGLMDLSTFAKFEVDGPDAFAFLERICANRMPRATAASCSAICSTRTASSRARSPSRGWPPTVSMCSRPRRRSCYDWISCAGAWRRASASTITDVTDDYGVLVLAGPRARDVLGALHRRRSRQRGVPLADRASEIDGRRRDGVRALRVNYVGELGWELHVPMADMPKVFDALMAAGEPHGIRLFGTYAMNSLRMEKAYRGWGAELTNEVTMVAADMERFVDFGKDFIGKAATLRAKQAGPADQAGLSARSKQPTAIAMATNPSTTATGWSASPRAAPMAIAVDQSLAFAYVEPALASAGQNFEILMMGRSPQGGRACRPRLGSRQRAAQDVVPLSLTRPRRPGPKQRPQGRPIDLACGQQRKIRKLRNTDGAGEGRKALGAEPQ